MCITLSETVKLSNTIIYSAEVEKPDVGPVHVIGYQNNISSYGSGSNAMILPIPTDDLLGPENVIDASKFPKILRHYADAVQSMKPKRRSLSFGETLSRSYSAAASYSMTFDSGSYTIALANSAVGLKTAINNVPENRKPSIPNSFLVSLENLYPDWPLAICCFNEDEFKEKEMEPVFWWFKSKFPEKLFAPAIDAHDGKPPQNDLVQRDHTLIFGNYQGNKLRTKIYSLDAHISSIPKQYQWMFTQAIVGSIVNDERPNGDFVFLKDKILDPKVPGYVGADQIKTESPFKQD